MRHNTILKFTTCLFFVLISISELSAQLFISRQVIGSTVFSSTPMDGRSLNFTAHTGEVFNATVFGDVEATIGFQQPDDDVLTSQITLNGRTYEVNAYPNPVREVLTLDFGASINTLKEVHLIDNYGRTILSKKLIDHQPQFQWAAVGSLPSGTYFLRAQAQSGQFYSLGTIIIATH